MQELDGILKFAKLIHDFQKVERVIRVPKLDRFENDVEHSYQLALVAWYIVSSYKLDLDIDKILKYALIHDLVEVYAGDTSAIDPDPSVHASKAEREHKAFEKLKNEFPEFSSLTEQIEKYESRQDEESMFVYTLDKILPPLNTYLDEGRAWKDHGMDLTYVLNHAGPRVSHHPEIKKYFDQLVVLLEKDQQTLFDTK